MTVSVRVSVNGKYKLPVSYEQGERKEYRVLNSRGPKGSTDTWDILFQHGSDAMTLSVGPEEPDNDDE